MKKSISILFILLFAIGCSEGDIIETSVNVDAPLQSCGNTNTRTFVFYKIDNASNQVLSLSFNSSTFSLETAFTDTVVVALNNSSNKLIYRELNSNIDGQTYFCSSIPPAQNNLERELVSENGSANITFEKVEGTDNEYTRQITLENITFKGEGIALRKEVFELGSEIFEATQ